MQSGGKLSDSVERLQAQRSGLPKFCTELRGQMRLMNRIERGFGVREEELPFHVAP